MDANYADVKLYTQGLAMRKQQLEFVENEGIKCGSWEEQAGSCSRDYVSPASTVIAQALKLPSHCSCCTPTAL